MRSRSRRRSSSIELPKRVRLFARQETGRQSVVISRVPTMPAIREFTRYADCFKLRSSRIQYKEAKSLERLSITPLAPSGLFQLEG